MKEYRHYLLGEGRVVGLATTACVKAGLYLLDKDYSLE